MCARLYVCIKVEGGGGRRTPGERGGGGGRRKRGKLVGRFRDLGEQLDRYMGFRSASN